MPHLWYRDLQETAHSLALAGNHLRIGRSEDCWLVLDSHNVSRVHAELIKDNSGQWTISDHGSANGTKINGEPVDRHVLNAGDVINIGGFELHFIAESDTVEAKLADQPVAAFESDGAVRNRADHGGYGAIDYADSSDRANATIGYQGRYDYTSPGRYRQGSGRGDYVG